MGVEMLVESHDDGGDFLAGVMVVAGHLADGDALRACLVEA